MGTIGSRPSGTEPQEADERDDGSELFSIDCSEASLGGEGEAWRSGRSSEWVYVVGESEPGKDWPRFHPGPLNAATGWRDHTVVVEFDRGPVGTEHLVLTLSGQSKVGPCPELLVDLNGHQGLWFLNPRPDEKRFASRVSPISGIFCLDVAMPGQWLAGHNRLALTTTCWEDVPEAERRPHRAQFGNWFGSGIVWDRVSLSRASQPQVSDGHRGLALGARSLPFFQARDDEMAQLVYLDVTAPADSALPGTATLRVGATRVDAVFDFGPRCFGQARAVVAVPELSEDTTGVVECGGADYEVLLERRRKWTLHLIPHVHLDIGYTDFQAKVEELHCRNLERAVEILADKPDFAFSVDGSFALKRFLLTRSGPIVDAIIQAIRNGRVGVNAFHSLFLTGLASLEECYRATYDAARFRKEHGLAFEYANITDVPGYSSALPGILSDLGIEYFMGIQNHDRGGTVDSDVAHLASPVTWEGVDGQRVLAFFSDGYSQLRRMFGDPQTLPGARQGLLHYLGRYERPDYGPDALPVVGSHADNEDLAKGDVELVGDWNAQYAWPRFVISTIAEYFAAVRPAADRLPLWRGDGGSYWEDGVGASAGVVAVYRSAQTLLPLAESLAALVSHRNSSLRPARPHLDEAWESLLLGCEHTWTWTHAIRRPEADQTVDQLRWKQHYIGRAERLAMDELRRGLSQLGELAAEDVPALVVYNGLAWDRCCDVEFEAPTGTTANDGGAEVPLEEQGGNDDMRLYRCRVDVPGLGYRLLALGGPLRDGPSVGPEVPGDAGQSPYGGEATGNRSGGRRATGRWTADLDPSTGRLRSLVNHSLGVELCDQASEWSMGEVLYVAGGGDDVTRGLGEGATSLTVLDRPPKPAPTLVVHPCQMHLARTARTAAGEQLELVGSGPSLPSVRVRFLLHESADRLDLEVEFQKSAVLAKEAVYVVFPFAVEAPEVLYDRQQGWVNPARDHSPGASNEWFTTQYAVGVVGPTMAVTWVSVHAPLFTLGDVVRGRWPTQATPSATILSYVMNNYWPTNFAPTQAGPHRLRYAIDVARAWDPAASARFGREVRVPPAVAQVTRLDKFVAGGPGEPGTTGVGLTGTRSPGTGTTIGSTGRLLSIDLPRNVVASVAQHRSGSGLLVRLQETAGDATTVTVPVTGNSFRTAFRCSADEVHLEELDQAPDGTSRAQLGPYRVVTLHLAP